MLPSYFSIASTDLIFRTNPNIHACTTEMFLVYSFRGIQILGLKLLILL